PPPTFPLRAPLPSPPLVPYTALYGSRGRSPRGRSTACTGQTGPARRRSSRSSRPCSCRARLRPCDADRPREDHRHGVATLARPISRFLNTTYVALMTACGVNLPLSYYPRVLEWIVHFLPLTNGLLAI